MGGENQQVTESKKKSALNTKGHFDYEKLVYPMPGFLPCSYSEDLEEITFTYGITGINNVLELRKEGKDKQYQFLVNFLSLKQLLETYKIELTVDNVFYDDNYMPCVKHRDLYAKGERLEEGRFLFIYKCYVGGLLGKNYEVRELLESGLEPLKKEASFKEFYEIESGPQLAELLRKRKNTYMNRVNETTVRIGRNANRAKSIISVAASVLLAVCGAGLAYTAFNVLPFQRSIIAAHESYVANDYVTCVDSMKEIDTADMDISSKYILAVAYAKSESLRKEELEGIISKLSLSSNEKELEYWIHLGRLEAQEAQDIAKALSDDKLLIYAYMKELNLLESNTTLAGEEKEARITQLEQNIKSLGEKYTTEEPETGGAAAETASGTDTEAASETGVGE